VEGSDESPLGEPPDFQVMHEQEESPPAPGDVADVSDDDQLNSFFKSLK
jgi:hypothetical protein